MDVHTRSTRRTVISSRPSRTEDGQRNPKSTLNPRRIRSWHVAGVVLLVAVGVLLIYAFWPTFTGTAAETNRVPTDAIAKAAARIEAIVLERGSFPLRAEATGHLVPWRLAEISAEASGVIIERLVEEGHRVAKGDLLLRLDDRDQQIELHEAEAERLKASAEFVALTLNERTVVPGDTLSLTLARTGYHQATEAYARGTLTRAELNEAERRLRLAEVSSGVQREAVQAVNTGLTQAEQRVERARLALSRTRVVAPFSGRIADLVVEMGQHIGAGQTVLTLLDDRRMKVAVDVLEADLVRMAVGASTLVRVPSLSEEPYRGTIYAINPFIDAKTGTGRVTVAIPNPQGRLLSGLYALVQLETRRLSDRLVVPTEAVLVRQGRDLVFRVQGGRAQWEYVTLGARSGDYIEILEGVSAGDTVAVGGHFAIAHDAPVEIAVVRDFVVQ